MTGFQECYQHAVQVKLAENPELIVKVVSLAGLVILTLISWDENSDRRRKDAPDLFFIIQNYIDAGNLERLFDEAPDIVEAGDYDYELGSARFLGRDIYRIATPTTLTKLIKILERESQKEQVHRIAMDVLQNDRFRGLPYERIIAYFDRLLKGLTDGQFGGFGNQDVGHKFLV